MSKHTEIIKLVDKSKCPYCHSDDIAYFEREDSFWCAKCHKVWQYDSWEKDKNDYEEVEEEEIEEWELIEE